ncbi:PAS domain S-box protein [Altericroceibacterium xinjiangense]|uniref:PAS domain S-box protein n=1 Tax=Altericroceibacterium xinjiangense TaxID=762261 RepID=UPI0013DE8A91|nr:PAS domain S-box protein [Altericroceibacterium xinjiangense]
MLRPMLEAALDAVVVMRADGTVADWNGVAEATFGWHRDEAIGRLMADLIVPPQHRSAHAEGLRRFTATGRGPVIGRRIEISALHKNGREFPVELSISPIMIGEAQHFIGFLRDISERAQSDQRLRDSEAQFRTMADNSPGLIWMADAGGAIVFVNQRYEEVFGYPVADLHGTGWRRIIHPDDVDAFHQTFLRTVTEQARFRTEMRTVTRSGEVLWLQCDGRPRFEEDGSFAGYVGVNIDITDTKQAQDSLRVTQRRLDAVLNNASVSIFLMDDKQQCIYMNRAAEQLTGFRFEETRGRPLHDVIHHTRPDGSHFPLHECAIDRAFPEKNNTRGEEVFVHRDGHFYPVAFTASPVCDEDANTVGTIIEVQDITERRRAENHQRLLIDELNHRVKNTLSIIQGIARQSFKGAAAWHEAREAFEGRLAALAATYNLLTDQHWDTVSISAVIEDTLRPFRDGTQRFTIEGPDLQIVPKTAVTLALGLNELATNAAKYGALKTDEGQLEVVWRTVATDEGERLRLMWRESGGPHVEQPSRQGFGTRMVERALAIELGGQVRIDFRPEGVVCTVDAPLPRTGA